MALCVCVYMCVCVCMCVCGGNCISCKFWVLFCVTCPTFSSFDSFFFPLVLTGYSTFWFFSSSPPNLQRVPILSFLAFYSPRSATFLRLSPWGYAALLSPSPWSVLWSTGFIFHVVSLRADFLFNTMISDQSLACCYLPPLLFHSFSRTALALHKDLQ